MSRTLTDLNVQVEELEKRIKAVSTANSTLAQIIAVRDSLEQVKTCINDLNSTLVEVVDNNSQAQLASINTQIENIQADITNLEADVGANQDDITTLQNDISTINSSLGEQSTTLTNLQTTQTNLQTTQTNQASTISTNTSDISSLKTRMTTAENSLNAITDGIDVVELENKIDRIADDYFSFVDLTMYFEVNNSTDKSRFYNYRIDDCSVVFEKFKLKYTTQSTSTMTVKYYRNNTLVKTISVDLSNNSSEYEFECVYYPTQKYNIFQFEITCADKVFFNGLEATVYGKNAQIFENDKDLKVEIYDNEYFVTKYENETITYERISADSELKISNLAKDAKTTESVSRKMRAGCYGVVLASLNGVVKTLSRYLTKETTTNENRCIAIADDNATTYDSYAGPVLVNSPIYNFCTSNSGVSTIIDNKAIKYYYTANLSKLTYDVNNTSNYLQGEFFFTTVARNNNYITNQNLLVTTENLPIFACFEDGFLYLIYGTNCKGVTKIAKAGNFATAYIQTDNSINLYINKGYTTYKYNLVKNENSYVYSVTFIEKITNCDCVYEIKNGALLKHTQSGWIIQESTEADS